MSNESRFKKFWYIIFAHLEHFIYPMVIFAVFSWVEKDGKGPSDLVIFIFALATAGIIWLIRKVFFKNSEVETKYIMRKDFAKNRYIYLPLCLIPSLIISFLMIGKVKSIVLYFTIAILLATVITILVNLLAIRLENKMEPNNAR